MSGYLLTFGETMALMTSDRPGPLAHAPSMSLGIGGSESNLAIGVQRLGVDAVWCGRVGSDPLECSSRGRSGPRESLRTWSSTTAPQRV